MIIAHLKGGLGNQMFQYAAALSLASHHDTTVKVDITELLTKDKQIGTLRSFDLQQLILEPELATEDEIRKLSSENILLRMIGNIKPQHKRKEYKEKAFSYDDRFFNTGEDVLLKGYWQSEKYFTSIKEKIKNGFQFKQEVVQHVLAKGAALRSTNSVSIHIRRGDYSNPAVRDYHGILGEDYYQQAISHVESNISDCQFYIFSDDPEWVKTNLKFNSPFEVISGVDTKTHFEDFYLITQCKYNIIANSTFSWWAAWLNLNKDKIVIAPGRWFNKVPHNTKDLIPSNWIKI